MEEISLSSRSPSLVDYERLSKRRRSDTSCSSGYQTPVSPSALGIERETTRLKRELAAVQRQLTQIEDTVNEHVEIRERIIKVSENEKDVLKSQLQEARQTIEELQEEVEITRRAQAAAELEFSQAKANMQLQIAVLVENAKAKDNTIYSSFERDEGILRSIKTEEELISNEDEDLEDNFISQIESNAEKEETGEQVRTANDRLSSIDAAITNAEVRVSTTPKETKTSKRNAQQLMRLNRKISDFFSKTDPYQSRLSGTLSPALEQRISRPQVEAVVSSGRNSTEKSLELGRTTDQCIITGGKVTEVEITESDFSNGRDAVPSATLSSIPGDPTHSPERGEVRNNEDDDPLQRTEAQQQEDEWELVHTGKYYSYLVSNRFFDVDWDEEYTRKEKKFVCKRCSRPFPNKTVLEDHVWIKHYDGRFRCPHCPNGSGQLKARNNIHMHVQMKHPELYHSEAFRQNIRRTL